MQITKQQKEKLSEPLPEWALKPNPMKSNMTVIHPMAIIDRLNEVFGVLGWSFTTDYIKCEPFIQKTKNGERSMYMSAVKGKLSLSDSDNNWVFIEQYGGSSNDDMGDALKGGATDALTKIASYLGIGASIYKGQGNNPVSVGLNTKEFAQVRDNYANNNVLSPEEWEKMNVEQKKIINQIKLTKRK